MHHQVGIWQAAVDFLDHVHGQDVAVRLAGELVGAVAGAHGNGQGIDPGGADEVHSLVGIGQQLVVAERAFEAVAVFLLAHAGFQGTQNPELTFYRSPDPVGHVHDIAGDPDIVIVVGGGLAVGHQGAVHHHRGEAVLDGRGAGGFVIAVVLVHADRDVGIHLRQGIDQVLQNDVIGIGARAAAGLDDDRGIHGISGLKDRQTLFHIVDVEGGHAIALLGGVIEKLSQCDPGHPALPYRLFWLVRAATPGRVLPSIHSRKAPPAVETKLKSSAQPA